MGLGLTLCSEHLHVAFIRPFAVLGERVEFMLMRFLFLLVRQQINVCHVSSSFIFSREC